MIADVERGRIVLWNRGAEDVFGWSAPEAEGQPLEIIIPPRYRDRHRAGMARYRATHRGAYIDHHATLNLPGLRKDGTEVELEMVLSPMADDTGRPFALAIIRDVTERARRDAQLLQANEALRHANEDLQAFAFVVSHDLKEPMRAIEGYLDVFVEEKGAALDPEAQDLLRQTRRAATRLRSQLERLLEYSRASREELAMGPTSVADVVASDACWTHFARLAKERNAKITVEEGIPLVEANADALAQVLGNLIANAIRHNPSPVPAVTISGRAGERDVDIVVKDNGKGFPENVRDAHAAGALLPGAGAGSGFGLAIARRAVERLGGGMRLENGPDGAEVHLVLRRPH